MGSGFFTNTLQQPIDNRCEKQAAELPHLKSSGTDIVASIGNLLENDIDRWLLPATNSPDVAHRRSAMTYNLVGRLTMSERRAVVRRMAPPYQAARGSNGVPSRTRKSNLNKNIQEDFLMRQRYLSQVDFLLRQEGSGTIRSEDGTPACGWEGVLMGEERPDADLQTRVRVPRPCA
jgi:hypothetical protein